MSDLSFSRILMPISIYLFAALIYYHIKVEKPMKSKFFRLTLEKRYRVLSKYTFILIGTLSTIRCLCDIGLRFVEGNAVFFNNSGSPTTAAEIACNVLPHISVSAVNFGYFFVYVFLWLRQSIFYVHPILKILYNNAIKAFSFSIFIGYLFFTISAFIAHSILGNYALNKEGFCRVQEKMSNSTSYFQFLIGWIILSVMMQISLMSLFIYPLLKQASWHKNQQGMQNHRMLQLAKKAVIVASVCLVTDIFAVIFLKVSFFENTNNPTFLYNVNLVTNHLVTIGSFGFWKKLLWPWNIKCNKISSLCTLDTN